MKGRWDIQKILFQLLLCIIVLSCKVGFTSAVIERNLSIAGTQGHQEIMEALISAYVLQNPTLNITFDVMSNSEAVESLVNETYPMVISDYPIPLSLYEQDPDLQLMPFLGETMGIYYSLLLVGFTISRPAIYNLMIGNITNWNDTRIRVTNPGLLLPNATVTIVYNTQPSLSVYLLTQTLCSISPFWNATYGVSDVLPDAITKQPQYVPCSGQKSCISLCRELGNAITFLDYNIIIDTIQLIQYARIINKNLTRTAVGPQWQQGLAAGQFLFNKYFTANIVDLNITNAYPVIGYSYVLLRNHNTPTNQCDDFNHLVDFVTFVQNSTTGKSLSNLYGFPNLPPNIVPLVQKKMYNITCDGKNVYSADDSFVAPPPDINYDYYGLNTFSGLTYVTYIPFYNYLGSTIDASSASTLKLSQLSFYGSSSSSASHLHCPTLLFSALSLLLLYFLF